MIVLRALGTAEIETGVAIITPSQEIVFAAGLYMVLERGNRVRRSYLASLLWPHVVEKVRNHRLRQTIHQMNKLGLHVNTDRQNLNLPSQEAETDVEQAIVRGVENRNSDALKFLPGYEPRVSEAYREWLDAKRGQVDATLIRVLLPRLEQARKSGNWDVVDHLAADCMALDPLSEVAVLAQAESLAMRGQKFAAVTLLDRYVADLGSDRPDIRLPAALLRKRVEFQKGSLSAIAEIEHALVGRGPEMALLTQHLSSAIGGRGAACLISGFPGVGKSRLSMEFARFAELQGVRIEHIGCKPADKEQPLSAFVKLIPRIRELPGALGCSPETFSWLKRLTEFDTLSKGIGPADVDSRFLYTNLRNAVLDLFDAVSDEECVLVLVEDIQWLDQQSERLFADIIENQQSKNLLFLFNTRQRDHNLLDSILPTQLIRVDLAPLSDDAALQLVRSITGARESLEDSSHWLITAGEGNPFFLQELAKQWLELGRQPVAPASIATVLQERISRLSLDARQLLQACAVLGEESTMERLEHILEYPANSMLAAIQELSNSGMLRRSAKQAASSAGRLHTRHDLLAVAAIGQLSSAALAFLHRQCGKVLEYELLGTSISASLLRACAFHWHHAGDSERAQLLAVKCADHLLEIGLPADAAGVFEGALLYCSTRESQLELLGRIVQALKMARQWNAVLETILRIRHLQESAGSAGHHDDLEILELEALRRTHMPITALFARSASCVDDPALSSQHRVKAAGIAFKVGAAIPALLEIDRLYRAIERLLSDERVDERSRLTVGMVYHTMCGDLPTALKLAEKSVALERQNGNPVTLIAAIGNMAYVSRRTASPERNVSLLQEAYRISIHHRLFGDACDYATQIALSLLEYNQPDSHRWMDRAREHLDDSAHAETLFSFKVYAALIAIKEKRFADARVVLSGHVDQQWLACRRATLAAEVALWIRIHIGESATHECIRTYIDEMLRLYDIVSSLGAQDIEVASLCQGLIYVGDVHRARKYLVDYLTNKRRALPEAGWSPDLLEVCGLLGVSKESNSLDRTGAWENSSLSRKFQIPSPS